MSHSLLEIKIDARAMLPKCSRTIQVSPTMTFLQFHRLIQDLFGLEDYHLWAFITNNHAQITTKEQIAGSIDFYDGESKDAKKTKISDELSVGSKILYEYDYGDGREFTINCKKNIESTKKTSPLVIKSQGGMLIEDVGGVYGLMDYLQDYRNKDKKAVKDYGWFDTREDFVEYIEPAYTTISVEELQSIIDEVG